MDTEEYVIMWVFQVKTKPFIRGKIDQENIYVGLSIRNAKNGIVHLF